MKALRKRLLGARPDAGDVRVRRHGRRDGEALGRARGPGLDRQERLPHQPAPGILADAVGDVRRPRGRRLRRARRAALRRLHALPDRLPDRRVPAPGVVDARRCIAYQSIENQDAVPPPLRATGSPGASSAATSARRSARGTTATQPEGDARFAPRPLSSLPPARWPRLTPDEFERLAAGNGGGPRALRRAAPERAVRDRQRPRPRRPGRRETAG